MTKESSPRPEMPRTQFSFFAEDKHFQAKLAKLSIGDLAQSIEQFPGITVPLLHELWRTNRTRDIHTLSTGRGSNNQPLIDLQEDFVVHSVSEMLDEGNESLAICASFLQETLREVKKGTEGIPYGTPLDSFQENTVQRSAIRILQQV